MFSTVTSYFEDNGWPVDHHDELPIVRMQYEGDHGAWPVYAKVDDARGQLTVLSLLPDLVPPDRREAVAELLTRANYLLPLGSFDMDFADGEVRFHATVDVSRSELTAGLIDPLVKANWVVVDDHLEALGAVVAGTSSPEDAITKVLDDAGDVDFDFTA